MNREGPHLPDVVCHVADWALFDAHFYDANSSLHERSYLLIYDPEATSLPDDARLSVEKFGADCIDMIDELTFLSWYESNPPTLLLRFNHDGYLPSPAMQKKVLSRLLTLLGLS
ncbi:hypothetical protein NQT62_03675 [Limnobacter humi]|uniref:Uncharacterized protein n=1 Tax=Limnobacter humi TaxID=1778671 RepID=A0ABT1WDE2_9BURK|nr:hypothetical protein [Limnobacter humi]MCQ8895540.1 hypothetical protein [Limnobacter humi]